MPAFGACDVPRVLTGGEIHERRAERAFRGGAGDGRRRRGIGCAAARKRDGVGGASFDDGSGLRGLSDRLSSVSGTVDLASGAGAGTRLVARIPLGSNGATLP